VEQEPRGSRVWRGLAMVCAVGGGCDGGCMPLAVYVLLVHSQYLYVAVYSHERTKQLRIMLDILK
jgi:hypothetical protein